MSAVPAGLLVAVRQHPGIEMPGYFQRFLRNRVPPWQPTWAGSNFSAGEECAAGTNAPSAARKVSAGAWWKSFAGGSRGDQDLVHLRYTIYAMPLKQPVDL